MQISPGISVLVTTIVQASLLPLILGALDRFVLRPRQIHTLPTWVAVATCFLSPLAAFSIQILLRDLIIYVKAKRTGAVLPPHNFTWVPGAIHRVISSLKAEETLYLGNISQFRYDPCLPPVQGDPLEDLTRKLGHTFNLRVLFTNRVRLLYTDHIDDFQLYPLCPYRSSQPSRSISKYVQLHGFPPLC